jgi:hypothetical protein
MQRYANLSGDSGVVAYEAGDGSITVEFRDGARYLYDTRSAGPKHIAAMQRLARAGRGLATYINRHVRQQYAQKWP